MDTSETDGFGVLTIIEVAKELRCSKAHIHNLINGRIHGVCALPSVILGRRKLIRRETLAAWIQANERKSA